jgi:hypothetical protein
MTQIRYVLRNLPGIDEVEALLRKIQAHPNPAWAPENDQLPKVVERVSLRLFGITSNDTDLEFEQLPDDEWDSAIGQWEQNFHFAEYYAEVGGDDSEQDAVELGIWESMGWDVTNGSGEMLDCLVHFQRQIICAAKGLKGRLPNEEPSEEEAVDAAERWASTLMIGRRSGQG